MSPKQVKASCYWIILIVTQCLIKAQGPEGLRDRTGKF